MKSNSGSYALYEAGCVLGVNDPPTSGHVREKMKGDAVIMKSLKEYDGMSLFEQESFISHALAEMVQKLYYENNADGLTVIVKNLTVLLSRAQDCLDCLDMLKREGDVYAKIYLLLEYMGKGGISEEFVSGLEELTERAQEALAHSSGVIPAAEEEREVLKRLNAVMDKHENPEVLAVAM